MVIILEGRVQQEKSSRHAKNAHREYTDSGSLYTRREGRGIANMMEKFQS